MKNRSIKPVLALFLSVFLAGLFASTTLNAGTSEKPCGKRSLFATSATDEGPCAEQQEKKPVKKEKNEAAKVDEEAEQARTTKKDKKTGVKEERGKEEKKERAEMTGESEETEEKEEAEVEDPEEPADTKKIEPARKDEQKEKEKPFFGMFVHEDPDPALSYTLRPFGRGVFASSGKEVEGLPAPPDYPVGPGDEIGVTFWGRVNGDYLVTVSNEGTIEIPLTGPLVVSGLTFKEVKELITRKARSIVGAEATVTMGRLRSIQVFVFGEVVRPGAYKTSSISTVTNALMAAGGTTDIGSLRRVELRRSGEKPRLIDVYDLLIRGDKAWDARLKNGDVVFVPVIGSVAGVGGNVKRPAIYELKGRTTLLDALELAGGVIPNAFTQQVQVERIEGNSKKVVIDINAREADKARAFVLSDGDFIRVSSVAGKDTNAVYLLGNVKRPGRYEHKPGMRLRDLLTGYPDLIEDTHLEYGLIKRLTPDLKTMLVPFNPGALFDGKEAENIALEPLDSIYIFSAWLFRDRPIATIEGEVRIPGPIPIDENHTVKDLVLLAGGPSNEASYGEYELYRKDRLTQEVTLLRLNLKKALLEGGPDNPVLKDGDVVRIHSASESAPEKKVIVYGQVNRPGEYPYATNLRVSDLVFAGGNVTESAYLKEAELASYEFVDGTATKVSYRSIDLERALAGDEEHNVRIRPYDSLFVRELIDWGRQEFVELKGEVRFPGKYIIEKGERLESVIRRAGGFTGKAYLRGAVFTRESVKELQQKNLEEAVRRVEVRLLTEASGQALSATSAEEPKQIETAMALRKELLGKLKGVKAQGRIAIDLETNDTADSGQDIVLEGGDTLIVPARPVQVQVIGAVQNPAAFIYKDDASLSGYIGLAGGLNSEADKERIFVLKSDGTAMTRGSGFWGIGLMSSRLDPGDTIIVPEKLDKGLWLREVKDVTQILYQIAVTAGVLIVAF